MSTKIILIADDHPAMRAGVKQVILDKTEFQNIIEAENGGEALKLIKEKQPNIAILDIQMPGLTGLQIAEVVGKENLKTDLILLTMFDDKKVFLKALDAGVKGYLLKDSSEDEIASAIKKVAEGGFYLSPQLSSFLLKGKFKAQNNNLFEQLTETELKIMSLIAELKSNSEIADELFISKRTVENHKVNISKKLDLNSSKGLLKLAVENKDLL
ncbi:MAG: response regulator transcription factor [Ignavibacteriaceae bacterium]